jgi:hypothetical protein
MGVEVCGGHQLVAGGVAGWVEDSGVGVEVRSAGVFEALRALLVGRRKGGGVGDRAYARMKFMAREAMSSCGEASVGGSAWSGSWGSSFWRSKLLETAVGKNWESMLLGKLNMSGESKIAACSKELVGPIWRQLVSMNSSYVMLTLVDEGLDVGVE